MKQGQADTITLPKAATGAPLAIELRHLRYFVALADAGSFTHAAEQMFIAQPTLSQQIRRLEEIVGTQLLQRRREGLQLTKAGAVLLDASRTVLSLVDHEVNRTRQAAGLGRQRLRVVVPPRLPDALAVEVASALRSAAAAADVDLVWMEAALDAEFSLIRQRRADAGLGWLTARPEALPAPLDAMSLGEFEPDVWIPSPHAAARRGTISLDALSRLDVIHGPRRAEPGTYDAWTRVLRTVDPRFEFTDPPLRHSLPMDLAFAATADRPAAVLTGPSVIAGSHPGLIRLPRLMVAHDMVRVGLEDHPLTATAALVWNGDLPRPLQQILFDAADGIASPDLAWASGTDAKIK
jgi:DNA-binding transcriptional LysR family regulator